MESTKRTINIALIGSGAMGRAHAAAVANLRYCYNPLPFEAKLHTLVTRDEKSAREKADKLGFANYSTDYTAVLENPEVVSNATTASFPWVITAPSTPSFFASSGVSVVISIFLDAP